MFVRFTTDRTHNILADFGLTSGSNSIVSLSEFTCEKEPKFTAKRACRIRLSG
jgi:hypothetical protein